MSLSDLQPPSGSSALARRGRIDHWARPTVALTGVATALVGLTLVTLGLISSGEMRPVVIDVGSGVLLVAAGLSLALESRGHRRPALGLRLLAVLASLPPLVVSLSFLREPRPVDLTLPSLLLLLVVAAALGCSLPGDGGRARLDVIGVLAASGVALATVADISRLVFGEHPLVLSPLPRLALAGLALLSAALLVDSIRHWIAEFGPPVRWLPVAVTLFFSIFALGVWSSLTAVEQQRGPEAQVRLSTVIVLGGVGLSALAGLAMFLAQESLGRLLAETRRLRASEKRYRELFAIRARAAIAESESRYRELFENMAVGVFQTTLDGELLLVNPALVEMLGYGSPQEVLALDLRSDIYADSMEREALIERLESEGEIRDAEVRLRRRDGAEVVAKLSSRLVRSSQLHDEPVIEGTLLDITEQRHLEQRLVQAQKMEAIGQLAGGVAHDFNNLLTAIGGYVDLALELLPGETPARQELAEIRRAGERAGELTRQLLAFSRQQVLNPEVIDLAHLIGDIENLLRRTLGEQIELETRLSPDLGAVRMDPTQLQQVLLNLAVNARDAMPEGGALLIAAENVEVSFEMSGRVAVGERPGSSGGGMEPAIAEGSYVLLRVRDEGEGMDEGTRRRAIDPFFTTKPHGRGTGLGLSTVYGIVKQSGGVLEIASEPGQGTEVSIYLTRVSADAPRVEPEARPRPVSTGGQETLLLVEDDPQVRGLLAEVLASGGYRVETASGSDEALGLCREGCRPDLVITDVIMPGPSGPELVAELRRLGVAGRVLFMSGYPSDKVESAGLEGEATFLSKPFSPDALLARVEEILHGG